ncbi:MAG: hypothetical protein IJ064_05900 [Bacteroidaceae bacterium]|nr:hypothetical protein [Bacteroidaceae bacterium]
MKNLSMHTKPSKKMSQNVVFLTKEGRKVKKAIQKRLKCSTQRAVEILNSLVETKESFGLNLTLAQIWEQEQPYIIKYGETSFNVGLLGKHQEQ